MHPERDAACIMITLMIAMIKVMSFPIATLASYLSGTGNEYCHRWSDAVWLGMKGGWLILFVDKRVGGR